MNKFLLFACLGCALLAARPADAVIGYLTGIEPFDAMNPTPQPMFELLPGQSLTVGLQVFKNGVTDANGAGGNIACFMRTWTVDDFGGARSAQTDLAMTYAGDAGTGSPAPNDRYTYSFRGVDNQKYEYQLFCRDNGDNTIAVPNVADLTFGQVVAYGARSGVVNWMNEDFLSFTGRGFERASNLSSGQLSSDMWRVNGVVEMDFGTTRTGGFFARGETLVPTQAGVYGVMASATNRALLLQPSTDDTGRLFDPGFIEMRLENTLQNSIATTQPIFVQYGLYSYANTARMTAQLHYRISPSKVSTNDITQFTALGDPFTFTLSPSQIGMQAFNVSLTQNIPHRNYLFLRWTFATTGTVTGAPDAIGLYGSRVDVNFGGEAPPPVVTTTEIAVPSSTAAVDASSSVAASVSGTAPAASATGSASVAPSAATGIVSSALPSVTGDAGGSDGNSASSLAVPALAILVATVAQMLKLF